MGSTGYKGFFEWLEETQSTTMAQYYEDLSDASRMAMQDQYHREMGEIPSESENSKAWSISVISGFM